MKHHLTLGNRNGRQPFPSEVREIRWYAHGVPSERTVTVPLYVNRVGTLGPSTRPHRPYTPPPDDAPGRTGSERPRRPSGPSILVDHPGAGADKRAEGEYERTGRDGTKESDGPTERASEGRRQRSNQRPVKGPERNVRTDSSGKDGDRRERTHHVSPASGILWDQEGRVVGWDRVRVSRSFPPLGQVSGPTENLFRGVQGPSAPRSFGIIRPGRV